MHQPVYPSDAPTMTRCVRCFPHPDPTGTRDHTAMALKTCPLCRGLGMTTIEAKNEWEAERLKAHGSGTYSFSAPTQDDTAKEQK